MSQTPQIINPRKHIQTLHHHDVGGHASALPRKFRLYNSTGFSVLKCLISYFFFCAMATGGRGLLDRLNRLMLVNVAIVDDPLIEDGDMLRLLDTRHISEAIELVRVLFTHLGGSAAARDGGRDQQAALAASVTCAIGNSGRSCWVRHMLTAAAVANRRESEDGFTKSFCELLDILFLTKRTAADYRRYGKENNRIRRVRNLPEAYRTFYGLADAKL